MKRKGMMAIGGRRAAALCLLLAVVAPLARAAVQPRGVNENAAMARMRALAELRGRFPWNDFDPLDAPVVIFERSEWALAFGFDASPPGFTRLADVTIAGRAVDRDAAGVFDPAPWSPALVAGRWAVVSEVVPPEAAPSGSRLGGRSSEESMAQMVGDAFALYLMRTRGAAAPHVPTPVGYPDSAELMALTALEHRLLLGVFQVRQITESTLPDYSRLIRQVLLVEEERARILGPGLAAAERDVAIWDGLRSDAGTVLYRLANQGNFRPTGLALEDPGFASNAMGGVQRSLRSMFPMSLRVDGPASTMAQIAARSCAVAAALERLDGAWRIRAVKGDRSARELLEERMREQPAGDAAAPGALLAEAKEAFGYSLLLDAARQDIASVHAARETLLASMIPPASRRVLIRLNGAVLSGYQEDAPSVRHLGGGSLLHPTGLSLRAEGLELDYRAVDGGGAAAGLKVITRAAVRSDRITEIALFGAEGDFSPLFDGAIVREADIAAPGGLKLEGDGLSLRLTRGRISSGEDGAAQIDLPASQPR